MLETTTAFDEPPDWDEIEEDEISPQPYIIKPTKKLIATVDAETDPFAPQHIVKPFAIGFRTPDRYVDFWGNDCVDQFFEYLRTLKDKYLIYAHNGGKFDFYFFLKYLEQNTKPHIINGRLVQVYFLGQEFRDSYALIPERLSKYKKDDIEYAKFVPELREQYKTEIRKYLQSDCDYLFEMVSEFQNKYGDKLTAASAAMAQLHSFHGFERITEERIDAIFREFYFGGRVQCFENGVLYPEKEWLVVDRNSMYPTEMRNTFHPVSSTYQINDRITDATDFASIVAYNRGALPTRMENGSLSFTCSYGVFHATIHEIRAGLETGTLEIEKVIKTYEFDKKIKFTEWADHFYKLKADCKNVDPLGYIFNKHMLTDAYGKFALNPRKFKEWLMTIDELPENMRMEGNPNGWTLHSNSGTIYIWERPSPRKGGFYNIATAASITGAARANLLQNLSKAVRPIYCDTDSIICEAFCGPIHATELGAWDIEATGNIAAIAGKKLYALFDGDRVLKKASKGCILTGEQILEIAQGKEIYYQNEVPAFSLAKRNQHSIQMDNGAYATFINRNIKRTAHG